MNRLLACFLLVFLVGTAVAQTPPPTTISYQGVIQDGGSPVADGSHTVQIRLFDVAAAGTATYIEDHAATTANGVFSVEIGGGTPVSGAWTDVVFDKAWWVETDVAGNTLSPRTALLSSPFARALILPSSASTETDNIGLTIDAPNAQTAFLVQHYRTSGTGVYAVANSPTGTTNGVYGGTYSTSGRGVYGQSVASSGLSHGVFGSSGSASGRGVFGVNFQSGGTGVGGQGVGQGVFGLATEVSGTAFGVFGQSASTNGRGVRGDANSPTGTTFGVVGTSSSTTGRGVMGQATAGTGATFGVYGQTTSTGGRGVFGEATASSGTTYGVYGLNSSTGGLAIFGQATASSGTTYGVYGLSSSTDGQGVYGGTPSLSGTTTGVWGHSASSSGRGVYAEATASSGETYGVRAISLSSSGVGIRGEATSSSGSTRGVFGASSSTVGVGVYGQVLAGIGTTHGVHGLSASTDGRGVYGEATASSGATYGVYGDVSSPSGRAGYFTKDNDGNGFNRSQYVAEIRNTSTGVGPDVLVLSMGATGDPGTSANFVGFFDGDDDLIGQIEGNGAGGISYNTSGADYAERLPNLIGGEVFESGDVLGVFGGKVSRRTIGADNVMVVSSNPAVVGNSSGDVDDNPAMAFIGQANVRVRGSVRAGDALVPSGREDGSAVAVAPANWNPAIHGSPVGRAWEAKTDAGVGLVNAAVGVDDLAVVVAKLSLQESAIASLRTEVEMLRAVVEGSLGTQ